MRLSEVSKEHHVSRVHLNVVERELSFGSVTFPIVPFVVDFREDCDGVSKPEP